MALWICKNDRVPYSVGAPRCPQCGSTEHVEEGSAEHEALLRDADLIDEVGRPDEQRVPAGPAEEVLAWVGDDKAKAQHALVVERASANPRSGLIGKLEKLAGDEAGK